MDTIGFPNGDGGGSGGCKLLIQSDGCPCVASGKQSSQIMYYPYYNTNSISPYQD